MKKKQMEQYFKARVKEVQRILKDVSPAYQRSWPVRTTRERDIKISSQTTWQRSIHPMHPSNTKPDQRIYQSNYIMSFDAASCTNSLSCQTSNP
jgi:hypothetical protein